jgi:Na+-driven multidrug efflux pump
MFMHVGFLVIFLYVLEFGVFGAGMAISCTYSLNLILIGGYCYSGVVSNCIPEKALHFVNADSFLKIMEFLKYGL